MATKTYFFKADHLDATTGLVWRAGIADRVTDTALQTRLEAATGPAGEKVVIDVGASFILSSEIGTSGAKIPLLSNANAFSNAQTFNNGLIVGTGPMPYVVGSIGYNDTNFGSLSKAPRAGAVASWAWQSFAGASLFSLTDTGIALVGTHVVWHAGNTTVDGSGFIKQASPIARVGGGVDAELGFSGAGDGAVNGKAGGVEIVRVETGLYEITGSLGLAQKGWQVEAPKDQNGNLLCHVETQWAGGVLSLMVSEPVNEAGRWVAGEPMDIPEGKWVDLRLHEPAWAAEAPPPEGVPQTILPSPWHVHAERDRRLALGFDYDFGDARGVHRIGTSDADMRGWSEVSTASSAALAMGQDAYEITIVTDNGAAVITAQEWQAVLLAASAFRQPIWQAAFALEAMSPIPEDFADDQYWQAPA